jgi:hypothetical protein
MVSFHLNASFPIGLHRLSAVNLQAETNPCGRIGNAFTNSTAIAMPFPAAGQHREENIQPFVIIVFTRLLPIFGQPLGTNN